MERRRPPAVRADADRHRRRDRRAGRVGELTATTGRRVLGDLLRAERRPVGIGVAAGLAWQLSIAAVPVVLGITVERGIVDGERAALWWGAALLLVLGAVTAGTDALRHREETRVRAHVLARLRAQVGAAALGADPAHREQWPPSELVARSTADVDVVADAFEGSTWIIAEAVIIPVVVVALVAIDPVLAAAAVVVVGLAVLATWRVSASWERRAEAEQRALAGYLARTHQVLEGFKVVRGLGAEAGVLAEVDASSEEARRAVNRTARLWLVYSPVVEVLAGLATIAGLWVGGERAISGDVTVGGVVAAIGLALVLAEPMGSVGYGLVMIRQAGVAAGRLAEILPGEAEEAPGAVGGAAPVGPVLLASGPVTVERLDGSRIELPGLSASVGELVVVDGATGAGKSTLLAVLAGDRPTVEGEVLLRGRPLTSWTDEERRRAVVLVGTTPFLLAASLRDNLRLGAPDASDADLVAALGTAQARDVVDGLPDGLDAVLADRGSSLSGGQRQRLALARAVLAAPEVLLLDAATSGLEPAREAALIASVRAAWVHGAIVVVSHNPAVHGLADRTVAIGDPVGGVPS